MAKKYIDADLLRAEIEKRLKNVRDYMNGAGMRYKGPKYYKAQGKESAYDALLNVIDSFQQEQQEVDLEEEADRLFFSLGWYEGDHDQPMLDCISLEEFRGIARHFYGLGLNAKEENK